MRNGLKCNVTCFVHILKKHEAGEITRFTNKERIEFYEQTLISKDMCPILEIKLDWDESFEPSTNEIGPVIKPVGVDKISASCFFNIRWNTFSSLGLLVFFHKNLIEVSHFRQYLSLGIFPKNEILLSFLYITCCSV